MAYESVTLKEELVIDELFSLHYFEYMSSFSYEGERHDFWEFLCVDKGEVEVVADDRHYTLKRGEIIFHKPNEFHTLRANGVIAPNLVVISFACSSPCMSFFQEKLLSINEEEQRLLAQIIQEARQTFDGRLDDPYQEKLLFQSRPPFGGPQLIKAYLELFLIRLYRRYNASVRRTQPAGKLMKRRSDDALYEKIQLYMQEHLKDSLSIEQICKDNLVGRSQLQKLFREQGNDGIINHFSAMKIEAAKQLIRNDGMNFTQISDELGYTSIHYFSRQFKKITGMTPSEYASSIKGMSDRRLPD